MKHHNQLGSVIALITSAVAFILALFDVFSAKSSIAHTGSAWFVSLFTLLAVIFSVSMFSAKRASALVLNVLCIIVASLLAIFSGTYWILICMIIALIGCIVYKAGKKKRF